jgi:hypothetical protein
MLAMFSTTPPPRARKCGRASFARSNGAHVDRHDLVEGVGAGVLDRAEHGVHGRVVHEDADAAERGYGFIHEPLRLAGFSDVRGDAERAGARRPQLAHRRLDRLGLAARDHHPGASACERERDRLADPARSAGHECHAAIE